MSEIVERAFLVPVPGVVWEPADGAVTRLVLLGHGGSGHKRADRIAGLGRWFAGRGVAAMAIDGPFHGDRVPVPLSMPDYVAAVAARGAEPVLDRIAADWLSAIDAAGFQQIRNIGYYGQSLGARYGLPTAVALGDRLRCAVLGKFGLESTMDPALDAPGRIRADAARITAPTLFHVQWGDTLFPRAGQFELFDLLAARDKRLIAFPGGHGETPPAALPIWRDFLLEHL